MKYVLSILLVLVLIAGAASAQTGIWRKDFTAADDSLTIQGWDLIVETAADLTNNKSYDYSDGYDDGGVGSLRILDNNTPTASYMRMVYNPAVGVDSSGMMITRMNVREVGALDGNVGIFGYSVASDGAYGRSALFQVRDGTLDEGGVFRPGSVIFKTAVGSGSGGTEVAVQGETIGAWRTCAFKWTAGGYLTAWILRPTVTSGWSSDEGDWEVISASAYSNIPPPGAPGQVYNASYGALKGWNGEGTADYTTKWTGLVLGSVSSNTKAIDASIDYVAYSNNDAYMSPWLLDPLNVPEPGSMLALASGLIGMAGFALRRRRA